MNFNQNIRFYFWMLCVLLFFGSCQTSLSEKIKIPQEVKDTSIRYAKRFAVCNTDSFKIIYLFASRNINDTTHRLVLSKFKADKTYLNTIHIKVPCKRIASLSSIYSAMITQLNEADKIIAIESIDYYNNASIVSRHKAGLIEELQRNNDLNREKTIQLNPDAVFTFGMGNTLKEKQSVISNNNIPFIVCLDHLEETPLARAEWIKFFACFLGKEDEANVYFDEVEKAYLELKKTASQKENRPSVFTELKFGDTWYVPAGKSYMSVLLKDAGADYLWADDSSTGSLALSFETVYRKAKAADYWLNVSMCKSLNEIVEQDKRYADFKAYQLKRVFNNNKRLNEKQYSEYWESGIISPHVILNDLIQIFNSDLAADSLNNKLFYYSHLKDN